MHSMNMLLAVATLLLTLASCRTAAPSDRQVVAELDTLFATLHARGLFDGAVVVGRDERITWQKGFGPANVAARAAFTPDTPTDTASMAKTITAALVISLHHEGRLDLDAPAQRLLSELPYETVTLRHMLSHSSGLPADYEYFERYLPPGEPRTAELFLSVLKEQKPDLQFPPGSAFEYNNLAFDLAALAAARAAGKPLGELLRERYFGPLSMRSAFLRPARLDDFPEPRTIGYRRAGDKTELHDVFDLEGFYGASNIYMSAADLHRWNVSFLRHLHHEPLTREFAQIGGHPSGLTLGSWYRSSDGRMFSYAGHLQGFHTEVLRDLHHRTSVVYVSNNTLEPWLQHAVVRAAHDILRGRKGDVPVEPDTVPVAKEEHDLLRGRWEVDQLGRIDIERSDGRLRLRRDGVSYPMFAFGPKYFYVPGLHFILGFSSRNARFDSIYVSSNFAAEWGRREVAPAAGAGDSRAPEVLALIPEGMQVLDIQRADLNRDGLHDFLVVCETTAHGATPPDMEDPERVLLLLVRSRDLRLRELGRSNSVIFCKGCGGMMGDPFAGISVDRSSFTVSNSGGTNWRWAEDYTFSYSRRERNFYLDRVSRIEFDVREPDRAEKIVARPSDFGRVAFADFDRTRLSLPWNQ